MNDQTVQVGVGVFIFKDGKFLIQQHQGAHGEGSWSLPGGHIEYSESFETAAKREVREETSLDITNIRFGAVTNDFFESESKHYITVWMLSDWAAGKEVIAEPDRSVAQKWCTFDDLPYPLFLPWQQLLKSEFIQNIKAAIL